jgi:hypothetical protein
MMKSTASVIDRMMAEHATTAKPKSSAHSTSKQKTTGDATLVTRDTKKQGRLKPGNKKGSKGTKHDNIDKGELPSSSAAAAASQRNRAGRELDRARTIGKSKRMTMKASFRGRDGAGLAASSSSGKFNDNDDSCRQLHSSRSAPACGSRSGTSRGLSSSGSSRSNSSTTGSSNDNRAPGIVRTKAHVSRGILSVGKNKQVNSVGCVNGGTSMRSLPIETEQEPHTSPLSRLQQEKLKRAQRQVA